MLILIFLKLFDLKCLQMYMYILLIIGESNRSGHLWEALMLLRDLMDFTCQLLSFEMTWKQKKMIFL